MASTHETGHARNAANFGRLIAACKGYGARYAPPFPGIDLKDLETRMSEMKTALDDVAAARTAWQMTVNTRRELFDDLPSLVTRASNTFQAVATSESVVADSDTQVRRIRGKRAMALEAGPDGSEADSNSVSQLSFDNQLANFSNWLTYLAANGYTSSSADTSIASLQAYAASLRTANDNVNTSEVNLANAIITRNRVFYDNQNGAVEMARRVKRYVSGEFGANSPEYAQISDLESRDLDEE